MKNRCILIVDDEVRIVRVIKDFLSLKGFTILEATDGQMALDIFYENNTSIDLILLDVMMPKLDGYMVLKSIREESQMPVIMLTAKGEEYDQVKGFELGVDDYVVKPFLPSLLLARIEAILKRVGKNENMDLLAGDISLNTKKRVAYLNDEVINLTRREFDLLYYFIINKDITVSRDNILNGVWGYDFDGDIRTVDTHIKQLRNKLKENGEFIKTIYRVGYKFEVKNE